MLVGTEAAHFEAEFVMTFSGVRINTKQFFLYFHTLTSRPQSWHRHLKYKGKPHHHQQDVHYRALNRALNRAHHRRVPNRFDWLLLSPVPKIEAFASLCARESRIYSGRTVVNWFKMSRLLVHLTNIEIDLSLFFKKIQYRTCLISTIAWVASRPILF